MSNLKLREVIKQIRQCKTAAEERAVISKESALIRNAFKVMWEAWVHEKRIVIGKQWRLWVSINIFWDEVSLYHLFPCRKKIVSIETATLQSFSSLTCWGTRHTSVRLSALSLWLPQTSLRRESAIWVSLSWWMSLLTSSWWWPTRSRRTWMRRAIISW